MRPQPRRAAFFQLSRSAALALGLIAPLGSLSQAQTTSASQLNFNRWQQASPSPATPVAATARLQNTASPVAATARLQDTTNQLRSDPQIRQANFQSPGDVQLPPLPGAGPAQLPDLAMPPSFGGSAAGALSDEPVLPPPTPPLTGSFNQFSNPGGAMPATQVQQAGGTGLRDVAHPAQLPPLNNNPQAMNQPGYRQAVFQNGQPAYGQQTYPQQPYGQQANGQVNPYANQGQVLPPADMRSAHANQNLPYQGGQLAVVSQDPRFISQPVRTGNYATVPFRAPLRTISYQTGQGGVAQLPSQQVATPQVQPPLTVASQMQPQNAATTSSLPQFQSTVGAQLTSYQTGYQAGQYCQPGVPQVVPGAVVPPTLTPNMAPQMYSPDNAGFKPLFSLGQENYNVLLGRGIIGQPTAYVPGQPVRNFMRYIFP